VEAGLLERDAERAGAGKKRKAVDEAEGERAENDKEVKGEKEVKRGDDAIDMVAIMADLNKAYPLVYWAFKVSSAGCCMAREAGTKKLTG
jgi:hypothetical protein